MRTPVTPEFDLGRVLPTLVKQTLIWGPIAVGLVHQVLMFFFGIDRIYVFVNPPEYIGPIISLGYEWWLVLLVASAFVAILAYSDRLTRMPKRVALPLYIYILFLLILVKPV